MNVQIKSKNNESNEDSFRYSGKYGMITKQYKWQTI